MKFLITLFTTFIISTLQSNAQTGTWKVCLNKKEILKTGKEDEQKNVKTITAKEWKKTGFFELQFTEAEKDIWFFRHFTIEDAEANTFFRLDSTNSIKISLTELRKKVNGKKEIHVYTGISPKDPSIAIRMRRVHLITLKLP